MSKNATEQKNQNPKSFVDVDSDEYRSNVEIEDNIVGSGISIRKGEIRLDVG